MTVSYECAEGLELTDTYFIDLQDVQIAPIVVGPAVYCSDIAKGPPIGDADCSLATDSIDAAVVLQYDAGLTGPLPCGDAADVNHDQRINSLDAAIILQCGAGLSSACA